MAQYSTRRFHSHSTHRASTCDRKGNDTVEEDVRSAAEMPDIQLLEYVKEPIVKATIIAPIEFTGPIKILCADRRGEELSATAIEGG